MVDANFKSSIYIKNSVKVAPITVTPVLYLSNGHRYQLADVNLEPSGTAVVNINQALAENGIAPWSALKGYVEIDYNWPWDALCVTVRSVDVLHSVIFSYNLQPAMASDAQIQSDAFQPRALEGIWWKHEPNVTGFVTLSNPAAQPISANLQVLDNQSNILGTHTVTVSSHGTKVVDLLEMQSAPANEGGVRVAYNGPEHGLLVSGGLEDLATGFSANLPLHSPPKPSEKSATLTYAAVGFMMGEADPMMRFPAGTRFTPYFVLRNLTGQAYSIQPKLNWVENAASRSVQLPQVSIPPYAAMDLNLASLISSSSLRNFNGSTNFVFDFQGPDGALLMAGGSVDQKNTYVFEARPQVVSESAARGLSYWSTANGDDTMINLWNPADEAQDLVLTLFFSGGHYKYPLHLDPRAAQMLNVSEIIQNQIPDDDRNLIPPSVKEGSAEIAGPQGEYQRILVVVDAGIYNVQKATCTPICITCSGAVEGFIDANPFAVGSGGTLQETFTVQYKSGTQYNLTASASWSSSNTTVATVAAGLVTGVNAGTLNLGATSTQEINGEACSDDYHDLPTCPETLVSAPPAPGNVPKITGIAPGSGQAGSSQVAVTISGSGFGSNAAAITIGGIPATVGTVNAGGTQITATFNLTTLSPGSYSVVVNLANGDGGSAQSNGWPFTVNLIQVTTAEVTVIGWVNGSVITLPSGENSGLQAALTYQSPGCTALLALWAVNNASLLNGPADVNYANAWLLKNSANTAPPATINPTTQLTGGNFRLFNDYQVSLFEFGGIISSASSTKATVEAGSTPDPCGIAPNAAGQSSPYNGAQGLTPSDTGVYELAEGRVGTIGQAISQTINGRTVPWIWNVIEFSATGSPSTNNNSIFPTFYVYVNGTQTATYPQSSLTSFIALDDTYQLLPSQIQ
jgi:hypothetical protein